MRTTLAIVIFIITLLYVGNIKITFSPFNIEFPYWHRALGLFIVVAGIMVYSLGEYATGYKKGLNKGVDMTIEQFKKNIEDGK